MSTDTDALIACPRCFAAVEPDAVRWYETGPPSAPREVDVSDLGAGDCACTTTTTPMGLGCPCCEGISPPVPLN